MDLSAFEQSIITHPGANAHMYVDVSGSGPMITQGAAQRTAFVAAAGLAKKHHRDLTVTLFNHELFEPFTLETAGIPAFELWGRLRDQAQGWFGGTDFAKVWADILSAPDGEQRTNLIITDFQWAPEKGKKLAHPQSLHYAPIVQTDITGRPTIADYATIFARNMVETEPAIAERIIGLETP